MTDLELLQLRHPPSVRMAVDSHDREDFAPVFMEAFKSPRDKLIDALVHSLLDYDVAYEDVLTEWPKDHTTGRPQNMTEERLKIATRNKMRERGQEFPEIARWRLRAAIGFRSEED